jgi:hypothetical protein
MFILFWFLASVWREKREIFSEDKSASSNSTLGGASTAYAAQKVEQCNDPFAG